MSQRAVLNLLAAFLAAGIGGCVIVDVGVTNPIPGLSTVAVAPFFNQSAERALDGRQVALGYSAELQKVPGFQVIPVGVTEIAIREHRLDLSSPDDALKLAALLGADAVVVGAVTDYDPYYPPRIGLTVDWYSPFPWAFSPGLPIEPELREDLRQGRLEPPATNGVDIADPDWEPTDENRWYRRLWRQIKTPQIVRGQSTERVGYAGEAIDESGWQPTATADRRAPSPSVATVAPSAASHLPSDRGDGANAGDAPGNPSSTIEPDATEPAPAAPPPLGSTTPATTAEPASNAAEPLPFPGASARSITIDVPLLREQCEPRRPVRSPAAAIPVAPPVGVPSDPRQPLMSYTRLFDGADAELTAKLRDYLELRTDLRSGSWPAALRRSDEFLRFTAHLMIVEMLTLHGGEGRRRVVLKFREH